MVLTTKLFAPPLPADLVARERLYAGLDRALPPPGRLILLSAPPGYGKSTLMASWLQTRLNPHVWLSLDETDNDPGQFCNLLLTALEPHLAGLTDLILLLRLPQVVNHTSVIAELINRAARSEQSLVVVLDDFHVIVSPVVRDLVRLFLTHLPPRWRLALLTREDPALNLPQLRARRQMVELRARDLEFSVAEGSALLGADLRADLVGAVVARTEGWAAGLQLAAVALAQHDDADAFVADFNGSHRFVLDYLVGEVIERLPDDLRQFLRRAAALDRFSAELCDAAFGAGDHAGLIARATTANLFVVRLDEQGRWHRLHHLMGDILRADLQTAELQAIAQRASLWFWEWQRYDDAIGLALTAEDWALAGAQVQQAALAIAEQGRLATVLDWIARLPEETLWAMPELCVYRAWLLVYNGRFREANEWIARIDAGVSSGALRLDDSPSGLLAGIRAWLQSVTGQPLDLQTLRAAQARVGTRYAYFAPPLLLAVGQAERGAGHFDAALSVFAEGARLADGSVTGLILDNNRAFLLDALGRRREARQLVEANIARFSDASGQPGPLAAIAMIPLGVFLGDTGDLDAAVDTLTRAVNSVRRLGLYDVLAGPATYQLQVVLTDLGRLDEALRMNAEAQLRAQQVGLTAVAEILAATNVSLLWQSGRHEPGVAWATAHPLSPEHRDRLDRSLIVLMHCRVLSAQGDPQAALRILRPRLERSRQSDQLTLWVREGIETVLILLAAGQRPEAEALTRDLVEVAAGMDYRQVFRRHLPQLAPLLAAVRNVAPVFIESVQASAATTQSRMCLVEPLTERELKILRLLTAGLSNAEIAERLFLAQSTIKWYLSETYGKLGVRRRTEAVARARDLGLM